MGRPLGLVAALIAGFIIFYLSTATPKPRPPCARVRLLRRAGDRHPRDGLGTPCPGLARQ